MIGNRFQHRRHRHHHHQQLNVPSSDEDFISSIGYPKIFGYLIPTLAAVVGVYVQGNTKSLMETHKVSLWAFLVATIFYCIALAAHNMYRRNHTTWGLIAVVSGSLSAVSLVTTLVPSSVGDIILYVAWILAPIIVVVYQYGRSFMNACLRFYNEILKPFVYNNLNWFEANNNNISPTDQSQRPTV